MNEEKKEEIRNFTLSLNFFLYISSYVYKCSFKKKTRRRVERKGEKRKKKVLKKIRMEKKQQQNSNVFRFRWHTKCEHVKNNNMPSLSLTLSLTLLRLSFLIHYIKYIFFLYKNENPYRRT
jgi:hypothetical protein